MTKTTELYCFMTLELNIQDQGPSGLASTGVSPRPGSLLAAEERVIPELQASASHAPSPPSGTNTIRVSTYRVLQRWANTGDSDLDGPETHRWLCTAPSEWLLTSKHWILFFLLEVWSLLGSLGRHQCL